MRKFLLIAALAVLPAVAFAQDAELVFSALDTDGDGSVSRDEASVNEFVSQGFDAADTNNDGMLSREEFLAAFGNG